MNSKKEKIILSSKTRIIPFANETQEEMIDRLDIGMTMSEEDKRQWEQEDIEKQRKLIKKQLN